MPAGSGFWDEWRTEWGVLECGGGRGVCSGLSLCCWKALFFKRHFSTLISSGGAGWCWDRCGAMSVFKRVWKIGDTRCSVRMERSKYKEVAAEIQREKYSGGGWKEWAEWEARAGAVQRSQSWNGHPELSLPQVAMETTFLPLLASPQTDCLAFSPSLCLFSSLSFSSLYLTQSYVFTSTTWPKIHHRNCKMHAQDKLNNQS